MGEQDRTANSHMWMILGLVFMFGYLLLEPWLPESNFEDFYFLGSYTLFYAAWVIFDGWAQVPFVTDMAITIITASGANRLCSVPAGWFCG